MAWLFSLVEPCELLVYTSPLHLLCTIHRFIENGDVKSNNTVHGWSSLTRKNTLTYRNTPFCRIWDILMPCSACYSLVSSLCDGCAQWPCGPLVPTAATHLAHKRNPGPGLPDWVRFPCPIWQPWLQRAAARVARLSGKCGNLAHRAPAPWCGGLLGSFA